MSLPLVLWDGSNLGSIDDFITEEYCQYNLLYVSFRGLYYGTEKLLSAQLYSFSDSTPLVVDELKIMFQLPKVGRHRVLYRGKPAILCQNGTECQLSEYRLDFPINDELKYQIQKCFVFRWLIGLTGNTNSSIRIRKNRTTITCFSYRDTSIEPSKAGSRIPQTVIKEWFDGDNERVSSIITEMINGRSIAEIRIHIESIIRRIDAEWVWIISYILDKLIL